MGKPTYPDAVMTGLSVKTALLLFLDNAPLSLVA